MCQLCYLSINNRANTSTLIQRYNNIAITASFLTRNNFNKIIKKRLQHRCFPVDTAKLLRTAFLQNTSGSCFCLPSTSASTATANYYFSCTVRTETSKAINHWVK